MSTSGFGYWCQIRVEAKDGVAILSRHGAGELGFVPIPGMKMILDDPEDHDFPEEFVIKEVTWCAPQNIWWIEFKRDVSMRASDCPCVPANRCCVLDSFVPDWIKDGWVELERWEWKMTTPTEKPLKELFAELFAARKEYDRASEEFRKARRRKREWWNRCGELEREVTERVVKGEKVG